MPEQQRKIMVAKPTTTLDDFRRMAAINNVRVTTIEFGGKKQMHVVGTEEEIGRTRNLAAYRNMLA